jgi:hypothetical protein
MPYCAASKAKRLGFLALRDAVVPEMPDLALTCAWRDCLASISARISASWPATASSIADRPPVGCAPIPHRSPRPLTSPLAARLALRWCPEAWAGDPVVWSVHTAGIARIVFLRGRVRCRSRSARRWAARGERQRGKGNPDHQKGPLITAISVAEANIRHWPPP